MPPSTTTPRAPSAATTTALVPLTLIRTETVLSRLPSHRRTTDLRCGKRLGREDHRVEWRKPVKPAWMEQPTSAGLPDQLTVRERRVRVGRRGFRTQVFVVVTTLLDARLSSAHDVTDLYGQRWHCELDLRSIKTALGMDVLRCRTPEMVRKELWMYVLASHLIRAVMVRAALSKGAASPSAQLPRCPAGRQRLYPRFGLS